MNLGDFSIKYKLWLTLGISMLALVAVTSNSVYSLYMVQEKVGTLVNETQLWETKAMELSKGLETTSSALGLYLLSKQPSYLAAYESSLSGVIGLLDELKALKISGVTADTPGLLDEIEAGIKEFTGYREQLLRLAQTPKENIPAPGQASTKVRPLSSKVEQLLARLEESEMTINSDADREAIRNDLQSLYFAWNNMIASMRAFLVYRSEEARAENESYRGIVDELLESLQRKKDLLAPEQQDTLASLAKFAKRTQAEVVKVIDLHAGDQWRMDVHLIRTKVGPLLGSTKDNLSRLVEQQVKIADQAASDIFTLYTNQRAQAIGFSVATVVILSLLMAILIRKLVTPIQHAVEIAGNIARGELNNDIVVSSQDETGRMLMALDSMQDNLRSAIEKDHQQKAAETGRLKQSLDNVSSSVMVLDNNLDIIYLNESARRMFVDAHADMALDDMDPSAIVGQRLQAIVGKASELTRVLPDLGHCHTAEYTIGSRTFSVVANPVLSNKSRLGIVLEWTDRTREIRVEKEVRSIVDASRNGDLSMRIDIEGSEGFLTTLASGINQLLDVSERIINDTLVVLEAMANGDTSKTIDADYEGKFGQLKKDANLTVNKLAGVIAGIKSATGEVDSGVKDILQGNTNLQAQTNRQAESLKLTTARMEEMTSMVRQTADNTRQAKELAAETRVLAEKGGTEVQSAVQAMEVINDASNQIAAIVTVIDEIAFQTNLLALNAAVEAARAGEYGRGFAVVASEVRALAGRSATAAKEIKELIQGSVDKVEHGTKLVNGSGETLNEIVAAAKKVSDVVADIARVSQQQSVGIEDVNRTILEMEQITNRNVALAEDCEQSSIAVGNQSHTLNDLIDFFAVSEQPAPVVNLHDSAYADSSDHDPEDGCRKRGGASL